MNRLARIVQSATPSTAVQFRKRAYGKSGIRSLLRDVLAMANASIVGSRYIIIGVDIDSHGRKSLHSVKEDDFSGKPAYLSLAVDHIEPPIRIRYEPVTVDGKRVGVFEIGDCQDRPYMMRVDHSETLRRGDAYIRVNDSAMKMGRRQLESLFENKFRDSVSPASIEFGFPGEIIHKRLKVATCNLAKLPSAVAKTKLQQLVESKNKDNPSFVSSIVARLTYARLFGSDSPYEDRSIDDIMSEIQQLEQQYRDDDDYFLYERYSTHVQLVIYHQGDEPLNDASYALVMPEHNDFHVAGHLPKLRSDNHFVERTSQQQAEYPAVTLREGAIHVSGKLGDVPPGEPAEIFSTPLRICVGRSLKGRRLGIKYSLFAHNLRSPAKGTLKLQF